MLIDNYNKFKVGTKVIILSEPSRWNSRLNKNNPTDCDIINYPYHCTIKEIDESDCSIAMTCGSYGWSLYSLVEGNLIILDIKEIRKDKLKKINHANR